MISAANFKCSSIECDSYFAGQKVQLIGTAVHSPDFYVAPWGKPPSKKKR